MFNWRRKKEVEEEAEAIVDKSESVGRVEAWRRHHHLSVSSGRVMRVKSIANDDWFSRSEDFANVLPGMARQPSQQSHRSNRSQRVRYSCGSNASGLGFMLPSSVEEGVQASPIVSPVSTSERMFKSNKSTDTSSTYASKKDYSD
jgi:hypothetical protein